MPGNKNKVITNAVPIAAWIERRRIVASQNSVRRAILTPVPELRSYRLVSQWLAVFVGLLSYLPSAEVAEAAPAITNAVVVEMERIVEVARGGGVDWRPAQTNQVLQPGDRLRT